MKRIYKLLNLKNICIITCIGVIISFLPVVLLTIVNRATGDDFGYGLYTHLAWVDTHSIIEVIKSIGVTLRQFYYGWQGTWFSIILFSLQPEVFHPEAYWIVAPLMISLFFISSYIFIYSISKRVFLLNKYVSCFMGVCYFFLALEFIPSTKSAIFWYNGCAHYSIPFSMCLFLFYMLFRYKETYGRSFFLGILIFLTLLSGSNYQAALLALMIVFLVFLREVFCVKNRKFFNFLLPLSCAAVGLYISVSAPGNQVRGGENLKFSFEKIFSTILNSFVYAFKDACKYVSDTPIILVFIFVIFLVLIRAMIERKGQSIDIVFQHPIMTAILLFCIYAAMQAPALYADVSVSGGVPNTNYQVFLLMICGMMYMASERIALWIQRKQYRFAYFFVGAMMLATVFVLIFRYDLKESTTFECYDYITEGKAEDFKKSMDEYDKILMDESIKIVELPPVNDNQGPLMYMPIIEDENAFTNYVVKNFYRKEKVIMVWPD